MKRDARHVNRIADLTSKLGDSLHLLNGIWDKSPSRTGPAIMTGRHVFVKCFSVAVCS
jgi:hypothetical protein